MTAVSKGEISRMAQEPLPIENLVSALARAQASMTAAAFNRVNPHFKSRYADLAAIRDATIPALSSNGLALVQFTTFADGVLLLHTRLSHVSGESIEGTYPIPLALDKPQVMGSALTYAKRYSWSSMCGIVADDDDDANAASKPRSNGVSDITLGQETLPKAKSRPVYEALIKEMRAIHERKAVTSWGMVNADRIHSMHDDFQKWFRQEYSNHLDAIDAGVTEEGESLVKKQLKASVAAEDGEGF